MRPRLRDEPDRLAAFEAKGEKLVKKLLKSCEVEGVSFCSLKRGWKLVEV